MAVLVACSGLLAVGLSVSSTMAAASTPAEQTLTWSRENAWPQSSEVSAGFACAPSSSYCYKISDTGYNGTPDGWLQSISSGTLVGTDILRQNWSVANTSCSTYPNCTDVTGKLTAIACADSATCYAVGTQYNSNGQGLYASGVALFQIGASGLTIGPPTSISGFPPIYSGPGPLTSIACPSSTECYSVGSVYSSPTEDNFLIGYVAINNGVPGAVQTITVDTVPNASVYGNASIACSSQTACYISATEEYNFIGSSTNYFRHWLIPMTAAGLQSPVSLNGFTASQPPLFYLGMSVVSVGCVASGSCYLAGPDASNSYLDVQKIDPSGLSPITRVYGATLYNNSNQFTPVGNLECTSSGTCYVNFIDSEGYLAVMPISGSWVGEPYKITFGPNEPPPAPPETNSGMGVMGCQFPSYCTIMPPTSGDPTLEFGAVPAADYTVPIGGAVTALELAGGSNLSEPGSGSVSCGCADPVDTLDGDFSHSVGLVSPPKSDPGLGLSLSYDAVAGQSEEAGGGIVPADGWGWTDSKSMVLSSSSSVSSGVVSIVQENGSQVVFDPVGSSGSCTSSVSVQCYVPSAPRVTATLTASVTSGVVSSWVLSRNGGLQTFTFDPTEGGLGGHLAGTALSAQSYSTSYTYGVGVGDSGCAGSGVVSCTVVSDSSGRSLVLGYSASGSSGQLIVVVGPSGQSWFLGYGTLGDLVSVTVPGGSKWMFTYDSSNSDSVLTHDMLSFTDPDSNKTSNVFDTSGRVVSQTDPAGQVTGFSYSGDGTSASGELTTVTDPSGKVSEFNYAYGVLQSTVVNVGTSQQATDPVSRYDTTLVPFQETNPDGNTTTSLSDSQGNVTSSTDPDGNTTVAEYNSANQVVCSVQPSEVAAGVVCPAVGSLPSGPPAAGTTDPNLGMTLSFYNGSGELTASTDPLGNTTVFGYTTSGAGVPVGLKYCTVDPVQYQDGKACPPYGSTVAGVVSEMFDQFGDVASSTDADGNTTSDCYYFENTSGGCASGAPSGGDGGNRDLLYSSTDPVGDVTTYTYNSLGEPLSTTVSHGSFTSTTIDGYDLLGNKYCVIAPDEFAKGVTACPGSAPSSYPSPVSDPWPGMSITIFNADSQPVFQINPLGGVTETAYIAGQVFCTVAPMQYKAGKSCPASVPTSTSNPPIPTVGSDGFVGLTITSYNNLGQVSQVTNPAGGITTYTYDAAGRKLSQTVQGDDGSGDPGVTTSYTYDAAGHETSSTVGSGSAIQTSDQVFDPDGNVFCSVSPKAVAAGTTGWQCPGWQPAWINMPPNPKSLYSTTPSSTQANNVTTSFFNADGVKIQETNPNVDTTVSVPDGDGHMFCSASGSVMMLWLAFNSQSTFPYVCPPDGTAVPVAGSQPGYSWTVYDPAGRTLTSTTGNGDTTTTTYDATGSALSVTDPSGNTTVNCYYWQTSTCASNAPSGGGLGIQLYSTTSPPTQQNPGGIVTTYTYTPSGRNASTVGPSGVSADSYDPADNLLSVTNTASSTFIQTPNVSYIYNNDDTQQSMLDGNGTNVYTYDQLGNQTGQRFIPNSGSPVASSNVTHSYYPNGELETIGYPATVSAANPTVTYSYNAAGQMLSVADWLGNTTSFGYDPNGNVTSAAYPGLTQSNTYDNSNFGLSTSVSSNGVTQAQATYTPNAELQVGSETDTGQLATTVGYSYDYASRLGGYNTNNVSYTANGNVTPLPGGATPTYDAASELTSSTSGSNITQYTYNTAGDLTQSSTGSTTSLWAGTYQTGQLSAQFSADLSPVTQVAAGWDHVLALHSDGTVFGWGANQSGELGLGSSNTSDQNTPQQIPGLSQVTDVASGGVWDGQGFSGAVTSTGDLYMWGYNQDGELGLGQTSSTPTYTPTEVVSLSDISQVATGNQFAIALKGDGTLWSWGDNYYGQLGDGNTTSTATPTQIPGLTDVVAVAAGGSTAAALTASGQLYTWGFNQNGELGDGTMNSSDVPVAVSFAPGVKIQQVSVGQGHMAGVDTEGGLWVWGQDTYGQLGDGNTVDVTTPEKNTSVNVTEVSAGGADTIIGESDGVVAVTGSNAAGSLGQGQTSPSQQDTFQPVAGITNPAQVVGGGYNFNMVVGSSGTIEVFGSNSDGQLGDNTTSDTSTPTVVAPQTETAVDAYLYAGNNLRVATENYTTSLSTNTYTWDTTSSVPRLLSDTTNNYIYGPTGQTIEQVTQQNTAEFLIDDQHGSTRLITNTEGNIEATYNYDPYGNTTTHTGTTTTPIGYAGNYTDPQTQLQYLQNRYYDPATAQFLSVDPAVSLTQAPYSYANDDPVNEDDPLGLWGWNPISDVAQAWNDTGGKAVHAAATHTIGLCLNVGAGWGAYGTASGCVALSGGHFTLVGTAGGGGSSPTASATLGLLISNASKPSDLRGPFAQAGGSVDLGLSGGDEGSIGNGSCGQTIWENQVTGGIGLDLPIPFEGHGGATYTWTWSP